VALFGRGPQTAVLAALIDGVRGGGGGGAVLVRGEPGIGKSALLASAETHASALGFSVVRLFGEPARTGVPFAGLQQFLATVHRLTGERRLSRFAYLGRKPGE